MRTLDDRTVEVWLVRSGEASDAELLARYLRLLTREERDRMDRYRFEPDRHRFLVTRALVRTALSRYEPVAPADWRFTTGPHGRPEIAPDAGSRLRFNLSRTDGLVACAVAAERDVGVDVEATDGRAATAEIAEHFFSPSEVAALRATPEDRRRDRFFTYWTLKEAYIKARGLGLAIPLEQISFRVGDEITIAIDARLGDDPASWQFFHTRPSERHSLAVAIRRSGDDVTVAIHETIPLVD